VNGKNRKNKNTVLFTILVLRIRMGWAGQMKKRMVRPAISVFRTRLVRFFYKRLCCQNVMLTKYQYKENLQGESFRFIKPWFISSFDTLW